MKTKFWSTYKDDVKFGDILIKSEFQRKGKLRYLGGSETMLIVFEVSISV